MQLFMDRPTSEPHTLRATVPGPLARPSSRSLPASFSAAPLSLRQARPLRTLDEFCTSESPSEVGRSCPSGRTAEQEREPRTASARCTAPRLALSRARAAPQLRAAQQVRGRGRGVLSEGRTSLVRRLKRAGERGRRCCGRGRKAVGSAQVAAAWSCRRKGLPCCEVRKSGASARGGDKGGGVERSGRTLT